MAERCIQGERLVTLEVILEQMSATLAEQKQLGIKTYEVLAAISLQGEQISSLISDMSALKHDVEEAFKCIRLINKRHDIQDGADKVTKEYTTKNELFWNGVTSKVSPYTVPAIIFSFWISDKFNIPTWIFMLLKEFKG